MRRCKGLKTVAWAAWAASAWLAFCTSGCRERPACTATLYGPGAMTLSGSPRGVKAFEDACREVLRGLSVKEATEKGTRYPHYGEGVKSHKEGDVAIATKAYLTTKDEALHEYRITTLRLGENDPVVILESTHPDPYKLTNALLSELPRWGVAVWPYGE